MKNCRSPKIEESEHPFKRIRLEAILFSARDPPGFHLPFFVYIRVVTVGRNVGGGDKEGRRKGKRVKSERDAANERRGIDPLLLLFFPELAT